MSMYGNTYGNRCKDRDLRTLARAAIQSLFPFIKSFATGGQFALPHTKCRTVFGASIVTNYPNGIQRGRVFSAPINFT